MNNSDADHRIQPHLHVGVPAVPSESDVSSPDVANRFQYAVRRQRSILPGAVFGALVGALMGAAAGAVSCWATGYFELFWTGVLIGALAGPIPGALIGLKERRVQGDLARPDIAIIVGPSFCVVPGLLCGLQAIGVLHGEFSISSLMITITAGPMIGLMIGALLDRSFEAGRKKSWIVAVVFSGLGFAACIGVLRMLDAAAYAPEGAEVIERARTLILEEWKKHPDFWDARIHKVTLTRTGRTTYEGLIDATIDGLSARFNLKAQVEHGMLSLHWTLVDER